MDTLKAPSLQSLLESDRGSTDSLLAESLQLELEELDDIEYDIPPTNILPTLESVLNEFEADSDVTSEFSVPQMCAPTPTPSIAEDSGVRGGGAGGVGSIMRYTVMQGVSAQISSATDRVNAGLTTACAVSAFIAVGTSHGHILHFDITQTLRWAHQDKRCQGAVTALAYNTDSTRLLAGYARGLVIMIDTNTGDVLRYLHDVITPNAGVLHVKWTSRPALGLCADSGGSVWSLSFTRKLGIRGCAARCLFSGARGEVCAIEPLILDNSTANHELDQYCIIALATLSKYFIVTIRPRLKVIKFHALQGPPDCLPVLSWQMVVVQAADTTRSIDPVLVVGRGNILFFHQLFMSNGRITLFFLKQIQLPNNILSVHWMGHKCVGCMTTLEILHLIDVRSSRELESIDMANAGLVYGSAQFKGLATGGNVSPALALAGTHACYNSIVSRGTQLYILGARSLHMIAVRTWTERITYLIKNQRWREACDLALDNYRNAGERRKRRIQAKERIISLFKEYIAVTPRAPEYCLGVIMKSLIEIGELELLWNELWQRLPNKELFLQNITEQIENDAIRIVNPIISQALVEYWLDISTAKLEDIIIKLDWTCLDLNQVLKVVKKNKLFRAQIHLNTKALNDFTLSLTELIPLIEKENESNLLGNCLLVYISGCMAGRAYPTGEIPTEIVPNVKHDVLRCLTSLHSSNNDKCDELPYPYLRALLKFDARETLNVIALAFQEKEFCDELGFSHRKRIIHILLEIMTPDNTAWSDIGCLLNFIAQQISMQCLPCDRQLLETVVNYLAKENIADESSRQHSERETAWQELLESNSLESISNDEEQLLLAKRAKCHHVEQYLLEKLRRYDNILECYLNNELRHEAMFIYMERHSQQPERHILQQLKKHFKRLLQINAKETTRLVVEYFQTEIVDLCRILDEDTLLSFKFLQNLNSFGVTLTQDQSEQFLELLCTENPEGVVKFVQSTDSYRVDKALEIVNNHELYSAAIYLYETQKNYRKAFDLSIQVLANTESKYAAACAQQISLLCARASKELTPQEREDCWFTLLKMILPRDDLKSITKSMLHEASQHVNLPNLVELVLTTHNISGSFGDIKDLLMSMLANSYYEMEAMQLASRILGSDLHTQFAMERQEALRGLWVTSVRCAICHNRLYNQKTVIILSTCGHAMHELCAQQYVQNLDTSSIDRIDELINDNDKDSNCLQCPCCLAEIDDSVFNNPVRLSQPSLQIIPNNLNYQTSQSLGGDIPSLGNLNLKAPPRKFQG